MSWLPDDFAHPERVDLSPGYHMRPIRESDTQIDYPAVMGSRESLWERYGNVWGWPPATMSFESDRRDLARHEAEIERHQSFNYALLDDAESELLGCVYIDPPGSGTRPGSDALASWWVVDRMRGTELERRLDEFVPRWLSETWGFKAVEYI